MDVTGTIDTRNPQATNREVRRIYQRLFGSASFDRVEKVLEDIIKLYQRGYPGYQRCDVRYHDLEHTLQAYLAMARLCDGLIREEPARLPGELVRLGLVSVLGHDSGYIKEEWDTQGTGAKYTLMHVERSKEFMGKYLAKIGFSPWQIQPVQNIISCTGVRMELSRIPFSSEEERLVGYLLGTADYLGQMSDPCYVEKLPILYEEFVEGGVPGYASAQDLIEGTPQFFEDFVMTLLTQDFHSVYQFAANHFGGRNLYIEGIRNNVESILKIL